MIFFLSFFFHRSDCIEITGRKNHWSTFLLDIPLFVFQISAHCYYCGSKSHLFRIRDSFASFNFWTSWGFCLIWTQGNDSIITWQPGLHPHYERLLFHRFTPKSIHCSLVPFVKKKNPFLCYGIFSCNFLASLSDRR